MRNGSCSCGSWSDSYLSLEEKQSSLAVSVTVVRDPVNILPLKKATYFQCF